MAAKSAVQKSQRTPKVKKKKHPSSSPYSSNTKSSRSKGGARVMEGVEAVYTESEDLKISGRPGDVFKEAQIQMNAGTENWKRSFEALNEMRYLTIHHKDILKPQLNSLVRSLLVQVGNLRSSIIKNALWCLQEFFTQFGTSMDKTLHLIIPLIVRKGAEGNPFLIAAGVDCCNAMIANCSPTKVIRELMITSRQDKSTVMKEKAVHFALKAVERIGKNIYEEKNRGSLEDVLSTIGPLLYDRAQPTRNTSSDLAKILADYAISEGEVDTFKRILQMRVPKQYSSKLEIILQKRLAGEITTPSKGPKKRGNKRSKNKNTRKKKERTPRTSVDSKRRVGKGKAKQKENNETNRDDVLNKMFESLKQEVADDVTF